jgi:hypothetical protein
VKKILLTFILGYLIVGCKPNFEKKIIGVYSIDEIYYNGQDLTNDLGVNVIDFDKNGFCSLPPMRIFSPIKSSREIGVWKTNSLDTTLSITAKHIVFNGIYKVSFKKDYDEKLLKIVLESEGIQIIATKGLQDFDSHKDEW